MKKSSIVILAVIAIVIITKVVGGIQGKADDGKSNQVAAPAKAASKKVAADNSMDPALLAAIVGAISMQERSRVESFRIVSINEKK